MTRIVAGAAGGRRLQVPPRVTRPTSDRVREALFSSLEALVDLDGAVVLDLYAGSGALGFEALSRGAVRATFVESDKRAAEVLKSNAKVVGLPGVTVVNRTAEAAVGSGTEVACDVVFADPPYAVTDEQLNRLLASLVTHGWTKPGSLIIVERGARSPEPIWPTAVESLRSKRYGDTTLHWAEQVDAYG
ncbi:MULTISPECIES: 16S rRNA (guanine(966)-N(2))-methyltransferase RsmD [Saccharothrix]|uniref:16S rRNA (guanine(966)-N(2))-methyltransferase RsmD n=1 Tax=Saccharothrix TaxID=2071 RepID=UPI0009399D0B|nr:16S rRNA (guanine(966)-N(2))-methyltransferase RsmD [Saccharothrix sp. CB00851]OKI15973.1 16S rRNA (guanine(966)-N(2))-methyltransferase RsmD [Saccharothrix sp. CB00851]